MKVDEKISQLQLLTLMTGYLLGDAIILGVGKQYLSDAWLVSLVGWLLGSLLIGLFVLIARLYPNLNLMQILQATFGRPIGLVLGALYIWYGLHVAALVTRSFADYQTAVNFPETPRIFVSVFQMVLMTLALQTGIKVVARLASLVFPLVPLTIVVGSLFLFNEFDFSNMKPMLARGVLPVIHGGLKAAIFPYGEAVLLLMIFPYLSNNRRIGRISLLATAIAGFSLTFITIRNLIVMGASMLARSTFPTHFITSLIPGAVTEPMIAVTMIIVAGTQIYIALLSVAIGVQQLFGLEDYKPLAAPLVALTISLSNLLYPNYPEVVRVASEVYPYYSIPFQLIIPLLVVIITLIKLLVLKSYKRFAKPSH